MADEFGVYWWRHLGAVVVVAEGVLDAASYGTLRDAMVKAAAEVPRAVIVDVDRIGIRTPVVLALFSTIAPEIAMWPGVPLLLVAANDANHRILADYRMQRYVPVHRDLEAAVDAIEDPPPRSVARVDLPNGSACFRMARDFVSEWCERWKVTGSRRDDAVRVAMALVGNTIKHTYGPPTIRVELRCGMLTVAVYDGDPEPAHAIKPGSDPSTGVEHGLTTIAQLSRTWGSSPTQSGGKVVWAVL